MRKAKVPANWSHRVNLQRRILHFGWVSMDFTLFYPLRKLLVDERKLSGQFSSCERKDASSFPQRRQKMRVSLMRMLFSCLEEREHHSRPLCCITCACKSLMSTSVPVFRLVLFAWLRTLQNGCRVGYGNKLIAKSLFNCRQGHRGRTFCEQVLLVNWANKCLVILLQMFSSSLLGTLVIQLFHQQLSQLPFVIHANKCTKSVFIKMNKERLTTSSKWLTQNFVLLKLFPFRAQ